jgi:hypothetical protein
MTKIDRAALYAFAVAFLGLLALHVDATYRVANTNTKGIESQLNGIASVLSILTRAALIK